MRVLMLAPANSTHTVRWVNSLIQRSIEVVLVSLPNHVAKEWTLSNKAKVRYLPFGGGKGYYLNAATLRKLYDEYMPDIIHAHYASGYGTLLRKSGIKGRSILSVWGSDVYEFPTQNALNMGIIKKNLAYPDYLCSTSLCMKKRTRELVQREDISVIPFGVEVESTKPKEDYDAGETFEIAIVKALEPVYGIDNLIRAFALFVNDPINPRKAALRIYGDGYIKSELEELATEMAVGDKVRFMGWIDNSMVTEVYREADLACFASHRESFGVSIIEAMAVGTPVVSTATEGAKEIIVGETGILIDDDEQVVGAMRDAMVELYDNIDLRQAIGKAGRINAESRYDWNKNVDAMIEVYRSVL